MDEVKVESRAPLKAFLFLLASAVAVLLYLFLLSALRGKAGAFSATIPAIVLALATLVINWRFFRFENRSLAEVGFDRPRLRTAQVVAGFFAGAATVAVWAVLLWGITALRWRTAPSFDVVAALGSFSFAVFNNAGEELVYRAYLFVLLARSYGTAVAVIATSILFAVLHVQAGIPWASAIGIVLTSAILFAVLFVRWRSLPLVLAFHVGINVMQELVGFRASGLTVFVPVATKASTLAPILIGVANVAFAALIARRSPSPVYRDSAPDRPA